MGLTTSAAGRRARSGLILRLWIVQRDHSIAGAFRTRREATAHARLWNQLNRRERAGFKPFVVGPYVLQWSRP